MGKLLQKGSKGDDVTALQNDLNALGFTIGTDGIFGDNTLSAVEQLQFMFGYTVDGKVGDGTLGLIGRQKEIGWSCASEDGLKQALKAQGKKNDSGSDKGADLPRTLKPGVEGNDVAFVQRKLRALGLDAPLSAKYDEQTKEAVTALQTEFGYDVDGMVGPATNKLIDAKLGAGWKKG